MALERIFIRHRQTVEYWLTEHQPVVVDQEGQVQTPAWSDQVFVPAEAPQLHRTAVEQDTPAPYFDSASTYVQGIPVRVGSQGQVVEVGVLVWD